MRSPYLVAAAMLFGFLAVVFTAGYFNHRYVPISVIAGENSIGTWVSGMLLVMSATTSLIIGMRRGWLPWSIIALFFLVLALDERFMFHEDLQTDMIMRFGGLAFLPVVLATLVGVIVAYVLWKKFKKTGQILTIVAVVLGIFSVIIDLFALGVFWEDSFKLIAELAISCAFLSEV